ncbi:MOSC domain-containing protein [Natrinema gelatinilyticum]|uniref:MOSC domain-containing protein n=1 Tax=Natrinema gelatinilyticum TaxID=2961571 RepID=UPI0020C4D368|nr:MOSC N-terminal beta barrel domain-containing protein [Natrinema gelatinilyticum]
MPELRRIMTYPIKALDSFEMTTGQITEGGTIEHDREYAVLAKPADRPYEPETESASSGDYINGKRTDAVHRLRSTFDPDARTLTLHVQGETTPQTFDLEDRTELNRWLTDYFDQPASVRRYTASGHHDLHKHDISGPSIISTATLREVASWFPEIDLESVRRRFRANLEIGGVPPFWEDRLVANHGEAVAFRIGDVQFEGIEPCERCVVISRDPDTGEEYDAFRQRFIRKRRETRPEWLDSDRFKTDFRLMTVTNVPQREWGKTIQVGDTVEIIGTHPY